ncbi:hypothetical protein PCANB_000972 [Pneumocystis canis]|nr:hypothetical protein PCK1_000936 [Pneumocystis canis]KAG5437544.1 hypothetical protein PCANB_000972 [Pneumocystis canis]
MLISSQNEEIIVSDTCKEILAEKKKLQNDIELRQKSLLTELFILCSLQKYFPNVERNICEKISESKELEMFLAQNSLMKPSGSKFDESILQKYLFSEENISISLKKSESVEVTQNSLSRTLQKHPKKMITHCSSGGVKRKTTGEYMLPLSYTNSKPVFHSLDYVSSHVPKHLLGHQNNKANRIDMLSWLIQTSTAPIYKLMQSSNKIIITRDWNTALIETKFIKVLERINKLKENNSWSFRQMIKQKTPSRLKAHWDFMLDEMRWLQADFKEERKWKIVLAKQIIDWIIEWHKLKIKSDICIQINSVNSHILSLKNEKYNMIDHNISFEYSHDEIDLSEKLHNQNQRDNENLDSNDMEPNTKKCSSEDLVVLHSSPLFIIENAIQLLEIPLDNIIATSSNFSLTSNSILPDLPVYQPPVPEDTLYHDPLDEMKIVPLSKYTQSHIRITHSDKFFKKRKRGMSPIDTDDVADKQRTIINDFSLSNSQISNSKKKSSYPSQLRPPNVPLNLENRKPIWTSDEDDLLMTYLPKYQFNWEFVAQILTPSIKWISPIEKKTAWDCFERWVQLDPRASNVIFVGPYAKMAYAKLEPLLKNTRANSYGGLFRSKKDAEKNMQNIKLKRQRQFNMFDAIRKTMKKREVSQKLNAGPSKKVIASHDTHGLPHKPSVAAPTPLDLSRLKHERDQVITQAYIRQRNAVVALALQNQARSSGRSNMPGINPSPQQIAQILSIHPQMNPQNRVQNISRVIPGMVNGLRFARSVRPSVLGQTSSNPAGITPVLRLPSGSRLSQEQMQQLILQRQQLLQTQRTQVVQQAAHCSDSEQNDVSSDSRRLASLNQHRPQTSIQNHGSNLLVTERASQS